MSYTYITLLFPNKKKECTYLDGALLMALGLRKQNVKHKIICMVTPDVSEEVINILKILYDDIIIVDYISPLSFSGIKIIPNIFSKKDYTDDNNFTEMCKVFTKLHIFNSELFPYDKVIFIDNDLIPISNFDELFELSTPAGWLEQIKELNTGEGPYYTRVWDLWENIPQGTLIPKELTEIYKIPGRSINAGLLVIKPDKIKFDYFIKELQTPVSEWIGENYKYKGSIDFGRNYVDYFITPEQDYLTQHFSGEWYMIDGKFCAWGNHKKELELYGMHMASLRYQINNVWNNYKTWMIQIPINDGFNIISNEIVLWGIDKYPELKKIIYKNLKFYINKKLYDRTKINETDFRILNDLQKKIILKLL